MGARKIKNTPEEIAKKSFLTADELLETVVPWSESTLKRKIKFESFPVMNDGGRRVFSRKEVELWFKKRTVRN